MSTLTRLGIIDWGIGGIDFCQRFRTCFPLVPVHYLSDSGFTPYGKLEASELRHRLSLLIEILKTKGASHVVIACNAASTVLDSQSSDLLDTSFALPCLGVIRPTLSVLQGMPSSQEPVLVLGGRRTMESEIYSKGLRESGLQTIAKVAQPLSALVEKGITEGVELRACIKTILGDQLPTIGTLVPACTHYTAVLPVLLDMVAPRHVIDPAAEALKYLKRVWTLNPTDKASRPVSSEFCTTGSPQEMVESARAAFGVTLPDVDTLHIS